MKKTIIFEWSLCLIYVQIYINQYKIKMFAWIITISGFNGKSIRNDIFIIGKKILWNSFDWSFIKRELFGHRLLPCKIAILNKGKRAIKFWFILIDLLARGCWKYASQIFIKKEANKTDKIFAWYYNWNIFSVIGFLIVYL